MGTRSNGEALEAREVLFQGNNVARGGGLRRHSIPSKMGLKMVIKKTISVSHLLAGLVAVWGMLSFVLPTSLWFQVHSVYIPDAESGDDVQMAVDREIHASFTGEYRVEVRTFSGSTIVCEAHGKVDYSPDANLPDPLGLTWWAFSDPRCGDLPDGEFNVKTTWEVERLWGVIPDGRVVSVSNFFTVGEIK